MVITQRLGVVFNGNETLYPFFKIDLVSGEMNEERTAFVSLVNKLDLTKYVDFYQFKESDRDLITPIRKVQGMEVSKFLSKNSPFAGIWENITQADNETDLPTETKELMLEYLHPKLSKLFPQIAAHGLLFFLPNRQPFKTKSLLPLQLSGDRLKPYIPAWYARTPRFTSLMARRAVSRTPVEADAVSLIWPSRSSTWRAQRTKSPAGMSAS